MVNYCTNQSDNDNVSSQFSASGPIYFGKPKLPLSKQSAFFKLPGNVFELIGDYLEEKLPLIIFTNRVTFKVSLEYQVSTYDSYLCQARH